jgi:hypothetical protein
VGDQDPGLGYGLSKGAGTSSSANSSMGQWRYWTGRQMLWVEAGGPRQVIDGNVRLDASGVGSRVLQARIRNGVRGSRRNDETATIRTWFMKMEKEPWPCELATRLFRD